MSRASRVLCLAMLVRALPVQGADCQALLHSFFKDPANPSYYSTILVTVTTLDRDNVASFVETRLYYMTPERLPCPEPNFYQPRTIFGVPLWGLGKNGRCVGRYLTLPGGGELGGDTAAKFDFGAAVQVFSDRTKPNVPPIVRVGLPHWGLQKFDEARAEDVNFQITDSDPVFVILTLRSRGNTKVTFPATCHDGGFLVGSTQSTHYVLRIQEF